jgi:hypothetical protein
MALSTKLKCPLCDQSVELDTRLAPGEPIRCPHCRRDFQLRSSKSKSRPAPDNLGSDEMEPERWRELLASETGSPRVESDDDFATGTYAGVTNRPLIPGSGQRRFTRNPMAPASESSKERLIGGKGVKFTGSRQFMAVVVIVGLAGAVYIVGVGLHLLYDYIERTPPKPIGAPDRDVTKGRPKGQKPGSPGGKGAAPAPAAEEETRTAAGDEQTIGFTKVKLVSATRPGLGALGGGGGFTLTLQITNTGALPLTYYRKGLTLRDRSKPPKTYALLNPMAENPVLQRNEPFTDVLKFEQTPMFHILDLDLPASASDQKFEFYIPTKFVETTQ